MKTTFNYCMVQVAFVIKIKPLEIPTIQNKFLDLAR
jgi:hypothetical protein